MVTETFQLTHDSNGVSGSARLYAVWHLLLCNRCELPADFAEGSSMRGHAGVQRHQPLGSSRAGGIQQVQHELCVPLEILILYEQAHAAMAAPTQESGQ